jgi:hypothetical protein
MKRQTFQVYAILAIGLFAISPLEAAQNKEICDNEYIEYYYKENLVVGITSRRQILDKDPSSNLYFDLTQKASWASFSRKVLFDGTNILTSTFLGAAEGLVVGSLFIYPALLSLDSGEDQDKNERKKVYSFLASLIRAGIAAGSNIGMLKSIYRIIQGIDNLGRRMRDHFLQAKNVPLEKNLIFLVKKKDKAASREALLNMGFVRSLSKTWGSFGLNQSSPEESRD